MDKVRKDFVRIAHLSDLHFANENDKAWNNQFDALKRCLETDVNPDVLLITGDLLDNRKLPFASKSYYRKSFRALFGKLNGLFNSLFEDVERKEDRPIFVVPGNHDYRYFGLLRSIQGKTVFEKLFEPHRNHRFLRDKGLIVACFDSNLNEKASLAQGKIDQGQFTSFQAFMAEQYKGCEKGNSKTARVMRDFALAKKIALLHHHPLPVALSETSQKLPFEEAACLLKNGGTFVREMVNAGVLLIFHGHEHYSGTYRVALPDKWKRRIPRSIGIIAAASVGKRTNDAVSFNVVDLYDDYRVKLQVWIARGQGMYKHEDPVELFEENERRILRWQDQSLLSRTCATRIVKEVKVEKITGDSIGRILISDWHCHRGSLTAPFTEEEVSSIQFPMSSSTGLLFKKPTWSCEKATLTWKTSRDTQGRVVGGEVGLAPALSDKPVDASMSYHMFNAFALTSKEREAALACKTDELDAQMPAKTECVSLRPHDIMPEQLILQVRFPDGFELPEDPQAKVVSSDKTELREETRYCSRRLHYSKESSVAFMSIDYPILESNYNIVWRLPDGSPRDILTSLEKHTSYLIADRLVGVVGNQEREEQVKNCLRRWSAKVEAFLRSEICSPAPEASHFDLFEMCILGYDRNEGVLKYLEHICLAKPDLPVAVQGMTILSGHPIAGLCFKRGEGIFHYMMSSNTDMIAEPLRLPLPRDHFPFIVALPMVYPASSRQVVGVLELASCKPNSILKWLVFDSGNAVDVARAAIWDDVQSNLLKELCRIMEVDFDSYKGRDQGIIDRQPPFESTKTYYDRKNTDSFFQTFSLNCRPIGEGLSLSSTYKTYLEFTEKKEGDKSAALQT